MLFTIGNKVRMNSLFEKSLEEDRISYNRFRVQPSILNNILWYGIAENDDNYQVAYYSLLDKEPRFTNWLSLSKNHDLIPKDHPDIMTLAWFSDEYYNVLTTDEEGQFRYNDLRYPMLNSDDPNSSVFSLTIYKAGDRWDIKPFNGKSPTKEDFNMFIERIKGNLP